MTDSQGRVVTYLQRTKAREDRLLSFRITPCQYPGCPCDIYYTSFGGRTPKYCDGCYSKVKTERNRARSDKRAVLNKRPRCAPCATEGCPNMVQQNRITQVLCADCAREQALYKAAVRKSMNEGRTEVDAHLMADAQRERRKSLAEKRKQLQAQYAAYESRRSGAS